MIVATWVTWWQTLGLALLVALLLNGALNTWVLPFLDDIPPQREGPKVSVLVPARNEAHHIVACVEALAAQRYANLEILVLDDESSDGTGRLLRQLQRRYPHLAVLQGAPLPPGWVGKNWACHQLAQAAQGEILLFVDADTVLHPDAVAQTVAWMQETQADLLSGLPYQVMETPAERLSLPFLRLGLRAILPHWIYRWRPFPALALAVGQFLAFRREAYHALGGHAAIRDQIIEDVTLARRAAQHGLRVLHTDLRRRVATRMYTSWQEIRQGFLKNLSPFFGRSAPLFLLAWLLLWSVFVLPWIGLALARLAGEPFPGFVPQRAWLNIALSLILWTLFGREDDHQWDTPLLYPLIVTAFTYLAFLSFYRYQRGGEIVWKDRVLRA